LPIYPSFSQIRPTIHSYLALCLSSCFAAESNYSAREREDNSDGELEAGSCCRIAVTVVVTLIGLMAFFFHVLNERSTVAPPFEPFVTLAVVQSVERHGLDFPWCDKKTMLFVG